MKKTSKVKPANQYLDVTKISSLERQIFGTNRIRMYTIENLKKVLPQLAQYLSKKIEVAGGGRSSKFNVELLDVPYIEQLGQGWRTYLSFEHGGLYLINDITIKDRDYEGGGHGVSYYKQRVEIGKVDGNGILTEISDFKNIVKSYDLKKVYDYKTISKLKQDLEKLKDKVNSMEWTIKRATGN